MDSANLRVTKRGFKQVWIFIWSAILIVASTLSGWGMAYSLAQFELEERQGKPLLSLGLIGFETGDEQNILDLLARNNSGKEIVLVTADLTVYGKLMHDGRVLDTCSGLAPVVVIQPNQTCWLTISFEREGSQYGYFGVSLENVVQFQSVNPAGEGGNVSAYIQEGGEVFPVAEIE